MSTKYEKLIIDGNNLLYRAFFSKNQPVFINNIDIGPIYRFLNMLKALVDYHLPKEIYFTWDKRLNPDVVNFRRELYPEYKTNRVESEDRTKIHIYCEIAIALCNSLGIKTILPYDLEADDVIYYLANKVSIDKKCLIISSDRDLLQLVNHNVHQFLPAKNTIVDLSNFEGYAGCDPVHFILYKAIMGDVSDNIKGLNKFGVVRAKTLAEKINNDLENSDDITDEQRNIITVNLKIMDLKYGLVYRPNDEKYFTEQLNAANNNVFDGEGFIALTEQYGLGGFRRQLGSWNALFNQNTSIDDWFSNITM